MASKKKTSKSEEPRKRLALVRIRGTNNCWRSISDTLSMMNLRRIHNLSFVDNRDSYKGMIQKGKDWIAWGEPSAEVVSAIIAKWGRLPGNKKVTDAYVAENTKFKTIDEFAQAFVKCEAELDDIPDIKPFFRLHPPIGGHRKKGIKISYNAGGANGYRAEEINDLIKAMGGL